MAPLDNPVRLFVIERPSEAIISEAIDIFCASFINDPPAIAFTGGDVTRMRELGHTTVSGFASSPGATYVIAAADAEGKIVAASFWAEPGKPEPKDLEIRERLLEEYVKDLPSEVRDDTKSFFNVQLPRLEKDATGVENADVEYYYCEMIMVRPDHQGRGIARAMFELAGQKADTMGAKMILWTGTDSNVELYKKLGFEFRSSAPILSSIRPWTAHVLTRNPPTGR